MNKKIKKLIGIHLMLVVLVSAVFLMIIWHVDAFSDEIELICDLISDPDCLPLIIAFIAVLGMYWVSRLIFYPLSEVAFGLIWRCEQCHKSLHRNLNVSYCHHCGSKVERGAE